MATLAGMPTLPPDQWTILPSYTFSLAETAEMCQLSEITNRRRAPCVCAAASREESGFSHY